MTHPMPTGLVSFVFTDIEGSTRLVRELGGGYGEVLAAHRRILREAWAARNGIERSTEGDSFFVVFAAAGDAVTAAVDGQRALAAHEWPHGCAVLVRMGIHTGSPLVVDDDYFGIDVNRAARIAGAAHGGQVVVSKATRDIVADALPAGVVVADLGEHRLKDLEEPEWVFQLVVDGLPFKFPRLRSLEAPTNLPQPGSSLVGREAEVAEIATLLAGEEVRLVTLTGPGGAGKTRLAIEVAGHVRDRFPNGVFFVSLASLTDAEDVLPAIAQTLGVEVGARPAGERLAEDLRVRSVLLVLDNFEHVAAAAPGIAALLAAAPRLEVIATSRASLRVAAEHEYSVWPLAIPAVDDDPNAVASSPAAALFIERARAVRPSFSLTSRNAPAVAEICRRLDGLPLAIELAAARARTLTPEQIVERLSSRLTLLKGGARDLPERQQTLRDTIAWSVDLLDAEAASVFRGFAVFAGGATVDTIESVLPGAAEKLDVLVDHNLIRAQHDADGRFMMLQTIREYASESLEEAGESHALREAHAAYFAGFAEEAADRLRGPDQAEWRLMVEAEVPNIRAALSWCLEDSAADTGRRLLGARIAAGAGWFWYTHGDAVEGCRWLELARERIPDAPQPLRTRMLSRLGILYDQRGRTGPASRLLEAALEGWRELGDIRGVAQSLNSLGSARRGAGDNEAARALFEESLALRRALDDPGGEASAWHNLGVIALDEGDGTRALEHFGRCVELDAKGGNEWGVAVDGCGLADALLLTGDIDGAEARVGESLRSLSEIGERDWVAEAVSIASGVAAARGLHERAARLAGAAWAIWRGIGFPPVGRDLERHQNRSSTPRDALGPAEYERIHTEGEAMTLDQAVTYALNES